MPGRGFPRYTLCARSFGAADTKVLDCRMVPLDQRRRLVNAAAISVAYVCLLCRWQRRARAAWRVMAMPGSCRSFRKNLGTWFSDCM
jgi:hypothetical protein